MVGWPQLVCQLVGCLPVGWNIPCILANPNDSRTVISPKASSTTDSHNRKRTCTYLYTYVGVGVRVCICANTYIHTISVRSEASCIRWAKPVWTDWMNGTGGWRASSEISFSWCRWMDGTDAGCRLLLQIYHINQTLGCSFVLHGQSYIYIHS